MHFYGCFEQVIRSQQTGVSHNDMIITATKLYNGVQLKHEEDNCGKSFKFFQAWKALKQLPKFLVSIEGSSSIKICEIGKYVVCVQQYFARGGII